MNDKKKQIIKISALLGVFTIIFGITYAFINVQLEGTKKQVITAGTLDLELDEDENNLTITDALPMYDEVGMIQDAFTFRLINNVEMPTNYILKLVDITTGDKLPTSIVKYGLTKNGVGEPKLLSTLPSDGTIDSGVIGNKETIEYSLRLWIDESVTDNSIISGKSLSYRIDVESGQATEEPTVKYFDYDKNTPVLDIMTNSQGIEYHKISNALVSMDSIYGKTFTAEFDDGYTFDIVTNEDNVTKYEIDENNYIIALEPYAYMVVGSIPSDNEFGFPPFSEGLWPVSFSGFQELGIVRFSSDLPLVEKEEYETITIAGVSTKVKSSPSAIFNYSSEGCIYDGEETNCLNFLTDGVYAMQDDDATSYFYRGNVDNLVKFGEYAKDYYVYKYNGYEFTNLDACLKFKEIHSLEASCTEDNKVLKYSAGTPMYWKIVRINGDGTVRLIYAGTTNDAKDDEVSIGYAPYNLNYSDPKYVGYTYDRTTNETDSFVKTVVDNWYLNSLSTTKYDQYVVNGKFCNDTSIDTALSNNFGMSNRLEANSPTFKCPQTNQTYGGSYSLKAGLLSFDEYVAAGGLFATTNNSFYLASGNPFQYGVWSMSPMHTGLVSMGVYTNDGVGFFNRVTGGLSVRPVINLRSDVIFKTGTNGTKLTPYEIVE